MRTKKICREREVGAALGNLIVRYFSGSVGDGGRGSGGRGRGFRVRMLTLGPDR